MENNILQATEKFIKALNDLYKNKENKKMEGFHKLENVINEKLQSDPNKGIHDQIKQFLMDFPGFKGDSDVVTTDGGVTYTVRKAMAQDASLKKFADDLKKMYPRNVIKLDIGEITKIKVK